MIRSWKDLRYIREGRHEAYSYSLIFSLDIDLLVVEDIKTFFQDILHVFQIYILHYDSSGNSVDVTFHFVDVGRVEWSVSGIIAKHCDGEILSRLTSCHCVSCYKVVSACLIDVVEKILYWHLFSSVA